MSTYGMKVTDSTSRSVKVF